MDFTKRDNVFTIQLPGSDLVFTRYLYIKEEVRIALLVSILNKSDDAIFWALELYYSGFKYELLNLIWKIYYDFFATLNPAYEQYLLKKHVELLSENILNEERIVSSIINDLLFRPFNSDVFFIRNLCQSFELDIDYDGIAEKITRLDDVIINMRHWISKNDFRSIAQWIFNVNKDKIKHVDIYGICLDIFGDTFKKKMMKNFVSVLKLDIDNNVILIVKIMTLFSKQSGLKKGRSIYINVQPEDIVLYETIVGGDIKHYRILEKVYVCGIDDFSHLSLFNLTRNKYNLLDNYRFRWEYHASFSPLWSKRIKDFGGYPDYTKQKVIFKEDLNDDLMQEFYEMYGLEPDEQRKEVQDKSIGKIEKVYNWKWFNEQYKKNGLFEVYEEELDEFDVDGLKY